MTRVSEEGLRRIRDNISCEADYQRFLEIGMEQSGWDVIREMSPDHSDYQADIVAKQPDVGWVGIECKYMTGGPSIVGEAVKQVCEKYADRKYLGTRIDTWGIAMFGRAFSHKGPQREDFERERWYTSRVASRRTRHATAARIVNSLGLGWVTGYSDRVLMNFSPSPTAVKIPLFAIGEDMPGRYYEELDMKRISELSNRKL